MIHHDMGVIYLQIDLAFAFDRFIVTGSQTAGTWETDWLGPYGESRSLANEESNRSDVFHDDGAN